MLKIAAPFPQAGSLALFVDDTLPVQQQRAELARVVMHVVAGETDEPATVRIALPLRPGASGSRTVPLADLIDATPLTREEERELADVDRFLTGKPATSRYAKKYQRLMELKDRLTHSQLLAAEMRKLDTLDARHLRRAGGSPGALMPVDSRGVA